MDTEAEIAELKQQIKHLQDEVTELRASSVPGSKTEALMGLQYDSLPDFYKTPRAIAISKRINTAGAVLTLVGALIFAIIIFNLIQHDRRDAAVFAHHYEIKVDPHS